MEIGVAPDRWPALRNVTPSTRYRVMVSFPYTIFYRVNAHTVLVLAFAHQKRQPLYWAHRA